MRLEQQLDYYDLEEIYFPHFNPPKKTRFRIATEDGVKIKTPDRRLRPFLSITPDNLDLDPKKYPSGLDQLIKTLPSDQSQLLELFTFRNGPQAVVHFVRDDLNRLAIDLTLDGRGPYNEVMTRAMGITFERLADIWMRQEREAADTVVLDVGSCGRVFRAIEYAAGVYLHPDGAIFTNVSRLPTLETICEYKTNPQHPNVQPELKHQIDLMRQFTSSLAGHQFTVNVRADLLRHIRFSHLKISKQLELLVVVPQDCDFTLPDEDITVVRTPIPRQLIKQVSFICASNLIIN